VKTNAAPPVIEQARIVSPTHRRIYTVDMENPESVKTAKTLMQVFKWRTYSGPAEVTVATNPAQAGWVVRGTDSDLVPTYATPRRIHQK
jgi:hypothetical protein